MVRRETYCAGGLFWVVTWAGQVPKGSFLLVLMGGVSVAMEEAGANAAGILFGSGGGNSVAGG